MTREEMRDAVGKALYEHWWSVMKVGPTWENVNADWRKGILGQADAAIAIIRGETLEEAARECGLSSVGLHFAAAIRALKEGK